MEYKFNLSEIDKAWLAGLIDGEGCISISKKKTSKTNPLYRLRLTIGNKNLELLKVVKNKIGFGYFSKYQIKKISGEKGGICYNFNLSPHASLAVLREVKPFLIAKAKQAELAIEFQERIIREKWGRPRKNGYWQPYPKEEIDWREKIYQELKKLNHLD